jgi:ATP-dependent DNA helicase UvrD/PcrA
VPTPEELLSGLNPEQRVAAAAVRGPVAILAGAGTGKTTTITHRIAVQVATRTFAPRQILAVTFTEKAGGELKARLARLGVEGVEARTFHSAGLSQLSKLWPAFRGEALPGILDAKGPLIGSLANALPPPHRFLPRSELAGEIEWAKNRRVSPHTYLDEVARTGHGPPIPAELMLRVFEGYERRKQRSGRIDFEDMLGLAIQLLDEHPETAEQVRARFAAFTVDEYQDVSPLQQALLERWLGDRDEICVVGDDYQTIYTFAGATPSYLLSFPERHPGAKVVRLERSYRSTPQVLGVANGLAEGLGGFRKELRATQPDGPNPTARSLPDAAAEVAFVVQEVRRLHDHEAIAFEEIAVLSRINARTEPYEEAFAAAGIPYQVRGGAFLRRPGPRAALARLRRGGGQVVPTVDAATESVGFDADASPDDPEEVGRQADLARLRSLAREFAQREPESGLDAFSEDLAARFAPERAGRGVQLLTLHRAKGLEFDAVFLPRLLDRELPFRSQRSAADPDEERRLLYVGITRARRHLSLSWPQEPRTVPSPFLRELGVTPTAASAARRPAARSKGVSTGGPVFDRLREWRRSRALNDGVPPYVVFHDRTLGEIAERVPSSLAELADVSGVGPAKLERYGDDVLRVLSDSA